MKPAARLHDVTSVGLGAFIGASGAAGNGGITLFGLCVAVAFVVARGFEDHYLQQIEKEKRR